MSAVKCNAVSKRTGKRCGANAMMGSDKCYHHGGKSPKGVASPHFKHGRYSKYLPVGLMDTFNEMVSDEDKLALDSEIALIDTYMTQLIDELGDYSSAELWEQLQKHVQDYRKAKDDDRGPLLTFILETIEAGASYVSKWDTLHKAVEQRRKLVVDERKRRIEAEQMISAEQAMLIVTGLLESVRRNVSDRNTLTAIQADFIQLTAANHQQRIDSGTAE